MIELSGFSVLGTANDGEEAVTRFKEFPHKPDIIIMDHIMPRKSGLEAAKEILELDPSAKIVFASADRTIKQEALSLGVMLFLVKPFKIGDFMKELRLLLEKKSVNE